MWCSLLWAALAAAFALLGLHHSVAAHEIRPAIVTVSFPAPDRVEITVSANLEALIAGIGAQHKDSNDAPQAATYNALRALPPDVLAERFKAFAPRWLDSVGTLFDGVRARLELTKVVVPDVKEASLARISTIGLEAPLPAGARTFQWSYSSQFGASVLRTRNAATLVTMI